MKKPHGWGYLESQGYATLHAFLKSSGSGIDLSFGLSIIYCAPITERFPTLVDGGQYVFASPSKEYLIASSSIIAPTY